MAREGLCARRRAQQIGYGAARDWRTPLMAADDCPLFDSVRTDKPFRCNALGRCRIVRRPLPTVHKCA